MAKIVHAFLAIAVVIKCLSMALFDNYGRFEASIANAFGAVVVTAVGILLVLWYHISFMTGLELLQAIFDIEHNTRTGTQHLAELVAITRGQPTDDAD